MAANSATVTPVTSSATSVTLLAANSGRHADRDGGPSAVIANDSTAILYVLLGGGTASSTNYSYQLDAKSTVPAVLEVWSYRGAISGIWASANGSALVTEMF